MALCFLLLLPSQVGWSKSFDFNDPKGFNSIEFSLAGAPGKGLVLGKIKDVEGTLEYNPSAPSRTTGKIEALTRSAQANAPEANAFLHGPSLFDVKRFPR
ncbi:MAG: YceI family protein, partial [Opitutales bacterium]